MREDFVPPIDRQSNFAFCKLQCQNNERVTSLFLARFQAFLDILSSSLLLFERTQIDSKTYFVSATITSHILIVFIIISKTIFNITSIIGVFTLTTMDSQPVPKQSMFFVVSDATKSADDSIVVESMDEAIRMLKKNPQSRMKKFSTKEEALSFTETTDKETPSKTTSADAGDFSPSLKQKTFPSIKPSEFTQLRRLIESKNVEEFEKRVWSNPRYLVSVCDTATLLMAGPKYNAAHIAARTNAIEVMKALLETVSDYKFFRKLLPDDEPETVQDTMVHVLDSYLNTPDPKQGLTPLHWACRAGHEEVVKVLLNYEETDITLRDAKGHTAHDIMLEMQDQDDEDIKEKKKRIEEMFLLTNFANLTIVKTPKNSPILNRQKD